MDPVHRIDGCGMPRNGGGRSGAGEVSYPNVANSPVSALPQLTWSSVLVTSGSPANVGFANHCAVRPLPVPVAGRSTPEGTAEFPGRLSAGRTGSAPATWVTVVPLPA